MKCLFNSFDIFPKRLAGRLFDERMQISFTRGWKFFLIAACNFFKYLYDSARRREFNLRVYPIRLSYKALPTKKKITLHTRRTITVQFLFFCFFLVNYSNNDDDNFSGTKFHE